MNENLSTYHFAMLLTMTMTSLLPQSLSLIPQSFLSMNISSLFCLCLQITNILYHQNLSTWQPQLNNKQEQEQLIAGNGIYCTLKIDCFR